MPIDRSVSIRVFCRLKHCSAAVGIAEQFHPARALCRPPSIAAWRATKSLVKSSRLIDFAAVVTGYFSHKSLLPLSYYRMVMLRIQA
jgi:hypothetical protein